MTALCLSCTGCAAAAAPEELAQAIRQEYGAMAGLTATAVIQADYGDTVYRYKVRFTGNGENGTVEVLEPQSIAGLSARTASGAAELQYDGAALYAGDVTGRGLSPMEALPVMVAQWQDGHVSECLPERLDGADTLAVTNRIDEAVTLRTWFDAATHLPVRAEIADGGRVCILCTFENVTIEQSEQMSEEPYERTEKAGVG